MSTPEKDRSFEESIELAENILSGTEIVDTSDDIAETEQDDFDHKETDDTIISENVDIENDDTIEGIDESSNDEDEDETEDTGSDDNQSDDDNEDTGEDDDSESDVKFSDTLLNLGIESEDKVIELHESWAASQKKLEKYSEKEELFYLLEQEKIDNVMDLAVAIKAASGDMSALNKILKDNNIDAVDLIANDDEIEEFKYDDSKISKSKELASDEEKFVAATTIAAAEGVKDDFIEKVGSWDEGSFKDIISSQKNAKVIAREIKTGRFDKVMKKVNMLRNSDFIRKYSGVDDLDMYKLASEMIGDDTQSEEVPKKPRKKRQVNTPKKEVKNSKRIDKAIKASEQSAASNVVSTNTDDVANVNQKSIFASDEELFAYVDSL